jgi:hypothetical protein
MMSRRDVGVWDFGSGSMHKLGVVTSWHCDADLAASKNILEITTACWRRIHVMSFSDE